MPTMVMGEVVEVNCTETLNNKNFVTTYRFDLDKKTVSYVYHNQYESQLRREYPLDIFEDHLLWFEKYGWNEGEPSVNVYMLNRDTGKLNVVTVQSNFYTNPTDRDLVEGWKDNCTRRI